MKTTKQDYFIAKYKFMIEQIKKNPHPIYAQDRVRILTARIKRLEDEKN